MRLVLLLVSWAGFIAAQEAHQHDVLKWIHETPGGYVHPDQEFRVDPATGLPGMFATKFIPEGTVLCQVPWKITITSDTPDDEDQNLSCGTVKALASYSTRTATS